MPFLAMDLKASVGHSGNLSGPDVKQLSLLQSPAMDIPHRYRGATPYSDVDLRPLAWEVWNP